MICEILFIPGIYLNILSVSLQKFRLDHSVDSSVTRFLRRLQN